MQLFNTIGYHSSPYEMDKFDETTGDKAKTGEGAMIHGFGLYLQGDKELNIKRYKDRLGRLFQLDFGKGWIDVRTLVGSDAMDILGEDEYNRIYTCQHIILCIYSECKEEGVPYAFNESVEKGLESFKQVMRDWVRIHILDKRKNELNRGVPLEFVEKTEKEYMDSVDILKGIRLNNMVQYQVEIPDNWVFLEEDSYVQPQEVKRALVHISKEISDKRIKEVMYDWSSSEYDYIDLSKDSDDLHYRLCCVLINDCYKLGTYKNKLPELYQTKSYEEVSKILYEHGINGIHYNGWEDGECWVIFNCKDLKIIAKE